MVSCVSETGRWSSLPSRFVSCADSSRGRALFSPEKNSTTTVWPDGAPKSNSLNVRLAHLRKRLAPLGFSFLTFANHGYMLEPVGEETIVDDAIVG